MRIAAAPLVAQAKDEARKLASALISMGSGVAGLLGLFFFWRFAHPLSRIGESIVSGVHSPTTADTNRLNWDRSDLLGVMSRASDHLLTTIGVLHQEELMVMQRAVDDNPLPVLQFDETGAACNANQAALDYFYLESLAELASLDPKLIQDRNSRHLKSITVAEFAKDGSRTQIAPVLVDGNPRNCLLTISPIRGSNGDILRFVMIIIDLEQHDLKDEQRATDAEGDIQARNWMVTTAMIRCCDLALQASIDVDPDGRHDCSDMASEWFEEAQRKGIVGDTIDHGVIPLLVGAERTVRDVIESAMLLCVLRAVSDKPNLSVIAFTAGVEETDQQSRMTNISVRERLPVEARPAVWVHEENLRWKMAAAALTRLVQQLGGRGVDYKQTKSGAIVEFSVPCDTSSRKKTAFERSSATG
jgi:PAS domain-containing protein